MYEPRARPLRRRATRREPTLRLYSRFVNISDLAFLVLTSLADTPRHGYSILREIDTMTSGRSRPAVATLYRTVERLAADGLVEEHGSEVVDGRFRRTYRLTESGAALLATEAAIRASTARLARRRLRSPVVMPEDGAGLAGGLA